MRTTPKAEVFTLVKGWLLNHFSLFKSKPLLGGLLFWFLFVSFQALNYEAPNGFIAGRNAVYISVIINPLQEVFSTISRTFGLSLGINQIL